MSLRVLFYLLLSCLVSASALAQQPAQIADTLQQLRQVKITDEIGYDVPPAAIPLLPRLKHQLLHLFENVLGRGGPEIGAAVARRRMLRTLQQAGIRVGENYPDMGYGQIYGLRVSQPRDHPELLVFVSELGIECGEDNSLYVFQRQDRGWRMVIAIESNGYKQVKGALGRFRYAVSPADDQGRWFLVYAHDFPWCTSIWNGIEYVAIRPGVTARKPVELIDKTETMNLDDDDLPRLSVWRDGFSVKFETGKIIDLGPRTWIRVARYRIVGDQVERVQSKRRR